MSESTTVRNIVRLLKAEDWWVMKIHGSVFQPSGIPDLLAIKAGRILFLEVKQEGEMPSKIQKHTLAKLHSAGATTAVVRSLEDVQGVLSIMNEEFEVECA